jgi:putative transposase
MRRRFGYRRLHVLLKREGYLVNKKQLTDGRRFRILTVADNCTRECLALVADSSLSGSSVFSSRRRVANASPALNNLG